MNVQRLYWLTFGCFGLLGVLNGWIGLQGGIAPVPVVTALAGVLVLAAAAVGTLRPASPGAPAEPGLLLYVVLLGAGLYATGTLFRVL